MKSQDQPLLIEPELLNAAPDQSAPGTEAIRGCPAGAGHRPGPAGWLSFLDRRWLRAAGVLLVLLGSLPRVGAACAPGGANLRGWWPGDGYTHNVVNLREEIWEGPAAYAPGVAGDAFQFDGSSKVRITEAASLDLSRSNRWTLTAWVNPATLDGADSPVIYSEGNRVAALGLQEATGKLVAWVNGGTPLESTVSVPPNAWTHVALVADRSTRTLYVNGAAAGTATGTPATTADSSGSMIGGVTVDDPSAAFLGVIDEITVHQRILSADEIAAIYAAGTDGLCYGEGALAWVTEPQSQTVPLLGNAIFTGIAIGSPRPTYQWFFEDVPLTGETGFTLELTDVTSDQAGSYALVATSGDQTLRAEAPLTVQHCVETPAGLVAWWPADGNALESTGNHSGEVWNGVQFPEGIAGQAFQFDGAGAYVAVPDSPELSPHAGAAGEMSIEAWVYLSRMPQRDPFLQEDLRVVLGKGDPGRWEYLLRVTTTGMVRFDAINPSGAAPYGTAAGGQIVLNRWLHLVGTVRKGQYVRLYQDGNLMAEDTTLDGDTANTGAPFYIGRRSEGGFLDGLVDEVAIYDRALTEQEVQALSDGGSVGKCYGGGPQPVFVQEPQDAEGYRLNPVTLEGLAMGTPRPTYQWYHAGNPVEGATNSALTISHLSAADAGPYVLVASNPFGETQSRTLILTVTDYASITEDFERGWDGWSTDDYSVWQVGQPTYVITEAPSGNNCAATVLDGKYPGRANSRLISPAFTVPEAGRNPRLRFVHWIQSQPGYDVGAVEIREVGTTPWVELARYSGGSLGSWARPLLALGTYGGKTVELGFRFWSDSPGVEYAGWFVDEVMIETGERTVPLPAGVEGFEGGWGDWYADNGVWQVGQPTYVITEAPSGNNCAATVLDGKYPGRANSRLISPAFTVPEAGRNPRLRFVHWIQSQPDYDVGAVEIREVGTTQWVELARYSGGSLGSWTRPWLALGTYGGKTVELGFRFWSDSPGVEYAGWYVDDLMVQVGNIGLGDVSDQIVDEHALLSFPVSAVGANANSSLVFTLTWAPEGAWIDPESGSFFWVPGERQGPGVYRIPVYVVDYGNGQANEMTTVTITVNEVNERPWLLPHVLAVEPGQTLDFPLFAGDRDFPRNPLEFTLTGAPAGATLSTNTGVLHWEVPTNAQLANYQLNVTLGDNGSPNFTTNNTIALTVTSHATYGLSVRHLGGADFEFTIHDPAVGEDYILQRATAIVDSATWLPNGDHVPGWFATLPEADYVGWLPWEDFVQEKLQRTEWWEVVRISPTQMPHAFVLTVTDILDEPVGFFRLVRVQR